mgnify:CR=1 FL=1
MPLPGATAQLPRDCRGERQGPWAGCTTADYANAQIASLQRHVRPDAMPTVTLIMPDAGGQTSLRCRTAAALATSFATARSALSLAAALIHRARETPPTLVDASACVQRVAQRACYLAALPMAVSAAVARIVLPGSLGAVLALFLDGPRFLLSAASRCLKSRAPGRQASGLAAAGIAITLLMGGGSTFADPAAHVIESVCKCLVFGGSRRTCHRERLQVSSIWWPRRFRSPCRGCALRCVPRNIQLRVRRRRTVDARRHFLDCVN